MFTIGPKDQRKHSNDACNAAYYLVHGSLAAGPDDAASLRMSKPVRLERGRAMVLVYNVSIDCLMVSNNNMMSARTDPVTQCDNVV